MPAKVLITKIILKKLMNYYSHKCASMIGAGQAMMHIVTYAVVERNGAQRRIKVGFGRDKNIIAAAVNKNEHYRMKQHRTEKKSNLYIALFTLV